MLEWMDRGACLDCDPELFFAERRIAAYIQERARRVCQRCPVQEECFWDAMLNPDRYAMRAGLTARELKAIRRKHPKEIAAKQALLSRVA